MSNFFSTDNPVFAFLSTVADIVLLSVVWIIFSIPIVTAIPATAAMYHTAYKVIRRSYGTLFAEFFTNFKKNLKQGIFASLLVLVLSGLLFVTFSYVNAVNPNDPTGTVYFWLACLGCLLLIMTLVYLCPLLSRFSMPFSSLLANSFCLALRHLPVTLLCLAILLICLAGIYYLFILLVILPALCCFLISWPMEPVLQQYMPKPEELSPDNTDAMWYWEK